MKKVLFIFVAAAAAILAGCSSYDDSELKSEIGNLDARLTTVENAVKQLQSDYNTLRTLVGSLENNVYVKNVTTTSYGWDILMTDGTVLPINNGSASTGDSIGVKKDTDGKYYWTINEEFLLVDNNKVPVYGETYVNPEFKIDGAKLYVKFAGDADFTLIGEVGSSVVPAISKVEEVGGNVVLTLADGTSTISIPKAVALTLAISGPSTMAAGATESFSYTLSGNDSSTEVVALAQGNWKAEVSAAGASGNISVTAPASWEDGKVVVLASNSYTVVMKVISITQSGGVEAPSINITDNVLDVPAEGKTYSIPVVANFQPSFAGNPDWVTVAEVKSVYTYSFEVKANESTEARSAVITFSNEAGTAKADVTVNQAGKASSTEPKTLYSVGFELAEGFVEQSGYGKGEGERMDGPDEKQWGIFYGQLSKNNRIDGTYGIQMRLYKDPSPATYPQYPYAYMNFDVEGGATDVTFKSKRGQSSGTSNVLLSVFYSTDSGASWVPVASLQDFEVKRRNSNDTASAYAETYEFQIPGKPDKVRLKFAVSANSPVPESDWDSIVIDSIEIVSK